MEDEGYSVDEYIFGTVSRRGASRFGAVLTVSPSTARREILAYTAIAPCTTKSLSVP